MNDIKIELDALKAKIEMEKGDIESVLVSFIKAREKLKQAEKENGELRESKNNIRGELGIATDISQRKQAVIEQQQATITTLSESLKECANSLNKAADKIHRARFAITSGKLLAEHYKTLANKCLAVVENNSIDSNR